jgi:L-asparaginase II
MQYVPLVVAERTGFPESIHYGSAIAIDAIGRHMLSIGDVNAPILPRSSIKPIQTLAMIRAGLDLSPLSLALASSSHSGQPRHTAGVLEILQSAHLDESDLKNTPDFPLDESERRRWERDGLAASSLAQNCSGQHAAMLATCVTNGWDIASYLDPEHPLQKKIAWTLEELAGDSVGRPRRDGCGVPSYPMSLAMLARCFAELAGSAATDARAVVSAMTTYPELIGGTGRPSTQIAKTIPDFVGKDGAEAVYVGAFTDGRALAIKISDGGFRALWPTVAAVLSRIDSHPGLRLLEEEFTHGPLLQGPSQLRVVGMDSIVEED